MNEGHSGGGKSEAENVAIHVLEDIATFIEDFGDLAGISEISGVVYEDYVMLARELILDHYTTSTTLVFNEKEGRYSGNAIDEKARSMADLVVSAFDFDKAVQIEQALLHTTTIKAYDRLYMAVNDSRKGGANTLIVYHGINREFDKKIDLALIERLFGSDEAIGVCFRLTEESGDEEIISSSEFEARFGHLDHTLMPDTESLMPDGSSAVCCTNYARYVQSTLGALGHQVQVVGFANEDNPTSRCAMDEFHPGGHDFAIVDQQYLVDPWVRLVSGVEDQVFYDLNRSDDAKKAQEIYGPRSLWLPLSCNQPAASTSFLSIGIHQSFGVTIKLVDGGNNSLHIERIEVPEDKRRQGLATAALIAFAKEAHEKGINLSAQICPDNDTEDFAITDGLRRAFKAAGFTSLQMDGETYPNDVLFDSMQNLNLQQNKNNSQKGKHHDQDSYQYR